MALTLSPAAIARTAPYAAYVAVGALGKFAADVDPRWIELAAALIVAALLAWHWRGYGELVRQTRPTRDELLRAIGVGAVIAAATTQLGAFRIGDPRDGVASADAYAIALHATALILLVPLMDELFWRSFLMRWLAHAQFEAVPPPRVGLKAIVLATFVYTLAHPYWLAAALGGVAYALLYVRTGKLWVAIVAHAVANAVLGGWVIATGNWARW